MAQNIAEICNHAAGVELKNGIDAKAIGRAFSYSAMDEDNYYNLHFTKVISTPMNDFADAGRMCLHWLKF